HTYSKAGDYAVTLTVTDDIGLTATAKLLVSVSATGTCTGLPPVASPKSFTVTPYAGVSNCLSGFGDDEGNGALTELVGIGPSGTDAFFFTYSGGLLTQRATTSGANDEVSLSMQPLPTGFAEYRGG